MALIFHRQIHLQPNLLIFTCRKIHWQGNE
jgi:hypothetical protein